MKHKKALKKCWMTFVVAFFCVIGVTLAVGTESEAASAKLKVSPGSKTIFVGDKVTFKANKKVKWSIVNKQTNVKIVSKSSKKVTVKGTKAGTVYVKAKAGKKTKKVKIEVRSKAPSKIHVASTSEVLGVGDFCAVYVTSVEPSYASEEVNYISSNPEIATVDSEGYVTGVGSGVVTITVQSKWDSASKSSINITVVGTRKGVVTMDLDFTDATKYPKGKEAKVWIPVPQKEENQKISPFEIKWKADAATAAELTKDSAGNQVLYVMWDENVEPADRKVKLSFHMTRQAVICPSDLASKEKGTVSQGDMVKYLKETKHTGSLTSGIVKETADQAIMAAEAQTVYEKANVLYNWVCDHLIVDKKMLGFGSHEVEYILSHMDERSYGSADVNEVFVALCRAEGIPARCIYGLQTDSIQNGVNNLNLQKCRSQFYLPGYGWVDEDIYAVLEIVAGHESKYRGENAAYPTKWKELKERYWGSIGEGWLILSSSEDSEFSSRQSAVTSEDVILNDDGSLYYFVYPYAEYDGQYIRCYNLSNNEKSELPYSYSFEQDVEDCGCD